MGSALCRYEEAYAGSGKRVLRPVIKLPGRFLTRILPDNTETTMVVHIRPGWEKLREFLIGRDAKGRYEMSWHVSHLHCMRNLRSRVATF